MAAKFLNIHTDTVLQLASWIRAETPHLGDVLVFVPLGDDEQLGQGPWELVPDLKPHLPHQVLLVLVELSVGPALQDLPQLLLLWQGLGTNRKALQTVR